MFNSNIRINFLRISMRRSLKAVLVKKNKTSNEKQKKNNKITNKKK